MAKVSQNKRILSYLLSGRSINLPKARTLCDCERLASRINDLRNLGHKIKTTMIKIKSGKWVAEYRLIKN